MSRGSPKYCQTGCGAQLKRTATKYCSIACCHRAQQKSRSQCLNGCGKIVGLHRARYCSLRCMQAHRYGAKVRDFVENGGFYGPVGSQFLARLLRELYGERCSECGWARRHQKTRKVPVEVEHVDGDWQNNRLSNLKLLCPNCHALTPTFRALNRGRGRAHRLGGRDNPLKLHQPKSASRRQRSREVFRAPSLQLELLPT